MRKLVGTGILTLSMVFAAYAHEEEHSHEEISSLKTQQSVLAQQIANLEAQLASVAEQAAATPAPAVATPAAAVFPRIRQSGNVSITPRMELNRYTDINGDDQIGDPTSSTPMRDANRRRLMLGWSYRLDVAVNDQIDLTFRLADPEDGATSFGSGQGVGIADAMKPVLPNAFFTWKASDNFRLSGGLLNVPSNAALEIQSSYHAGSPTNGWGNTYHGSLAGFNLAFPISSTFSAFVTAGMSDNEGRNSMEVDGDTILNRNGGRIIVGATMTLAEKKVTLRPTLNILTLGGKTVIADTVATRGAHISQGLDMGFKLADQFTLNADFAALQHNAEDVLSRKISMFRFGAEPIITFGGEKNNLFTARVRYAMDILANNAEAAKDNEESANIHFVDARLGIAVAPRFTITPRYRLWAGNLDGAWYGRGLGTSDMSGNEDGSRALHRFELGFATSF